MGKPRTPAELIEEVRGLITTTQLAEIGSPAFELAKTKLAARAGALADALEDENGRHADTAAMLNVTRRELEQERAAHAETRARLAILVGEVAKP